jgi:hypothetical protein
MFLGPVDTKREAWDECQLGHNISRHDFRLMDLSPPNCPWSNGCPAILAHSSLQVRPSADVISVLMYRITGLHHQVCWPLPQPRLGCLRSGREDVITAEMYGLHLDMATYLHLLHLFHPIWSTDHLHLRPTFHILHLPITSRYLRNATCRPQDKLETSSAHCTPTISNWTKMAMWS